MEGHNVARVPLQLSRNCIVASIQVDLSEAVLGGFRSDLLSLLQKSGATGVILDVSGIEILDLEEFQALRDTMSMATLMGARTVFAGFRAGVVSALVELDAPTDDICAAFNLDAAFDLLAETTGEIGADSEAGEEEDKDADRDPAGEACER